MPNDFLRQLKWALGLILSVSLLTGCLQRSERNATERISQTLAETKTKTDNLRKAMRFLAQMTPLNRQLVSHEVQLELNTWLETMDGDSVPFRPSPLLQALPPEALDIVGCKSPLVLEFSYWDTDYLFERRLMNKLAKWIIDFPLRDSLLVQAIDVRSKQLSQKQQIQLTEACKLFDWAMRNVALVSDASSVEETSVLPEFPISDDGVGFGYLPWETLLFSKGDFIERGRVFTALAEQRGLDTAWIALKSKVEPTRLWAIGVVIGDDMLVFESKLSMPILNPDTGDFATLEEARSNERILRRLDLPGQFDYAISQGDLESVELLLDVPPAAGSARMKMLQDSLLGDERMVTYRDLNSAQQRLKQVVPGSEARVWSLPLMAQTHAASVRERLQTLSEFTMQYMAEHGVWMLDNPASLGRLNHLFGKFENTLDEQGALSMYMSTRTDNESIERLLYDPEVQQELGIGREPNEELDQFQARLRQAQFIIRRAKIDSSFLVGQLHFDRGNYDASEAWFLDRVIESENEFAADWQPISRYCLARIFQERGELEKAEEQLTFQPSPQEAGNRLRLRYLRRMLEPKPADPK